MNSIVFHLVHTPLHKLSLLQVYLLSIILTSIIIGLALIGIQMLRDKYRYDLNDFLCKIFGHKIGNIHTTGRYPKTLYLQFRVVQRLVFSLGYSCSRCGDEIDLIKDIQVGNKEKTYFAINRALGRDKYGREIR